MCKGHKFHSEGSSSFFLIELKKREEGALFCVLPHTFMREGKIVIAEYEGV